MMRNHVRILVFLILTGSQGSSFGYVIGGSNLGFLGYEEHSCTKPTPPYKPFSLDNQWEIERYNLGVDSYNRELEIFYDCITEYIENAENDIKRIREAINEAIDTAN